MSPDLLAPQLLAPHLLVKLPLALALGLISAAALSDLASYRIPNRLVAPLAALYPPGALLDPAGLDPWAPAVAALLLALGFALFAWGKLGGGDAKLLAAVGLWAGLADAPAFLLVTCLAGGALSLAALGPGRLAATYVAARVGALRLHQGLAAGQVPYGVAIAAGGLSVLLPRLAA
jgi:prepilin peptidase CpaA